MLELGLRTGPAAALGAGDEAGPFRLLVRLFLRRFLENDLLSADGDSRVNLAAIAALLAAPGVFALAFLTLAYAGPFLTPSERLVMALDHKYQFIAAPMILAALAAALEWDAMALDARDLSILGPLPIRPRRLLGAKISALVVLLAGLAAAVSLVPTLGFPVVWMSLVPIGPVQGARLTLVHGLVSLAAAAIGFLAVVVVRSLVVVASPLRALRAASTVTQFALVLCLGTTFLLSPMLPADVRAAVERPTPATLANPAMWMLGAYERLTARPLYSSPRFTGPATWTFWERQHRRREQNLGPEVWAHPLPLFRTEAAARERYRAMMPVLDALAARAALALPLLLVAAAGSYGLAHRRRSRRQYEVPARAAGPRRIARQAGMRLPRALTPRPLGRATFAFTLQALSRNAPQRLQVAGALALGGALAIMLAGGGSGPAALSSRPASSFLALEYLLVVFTLAGVRRAFGLPAELCANWVFRLVLDGSDPRHALAGVRRAVAAAVIVPLAAVPALAHAAVWGPIAGATHALVAGLLSLVLLEVLLAGFDRVPFTSPRAQHDARVRWPFQLAALVGVAYACGEIEAAAASGIAPLAVVAGAATGAIAGIRWAARRWPRGDGRLTFEGRAEEAVQTLDIPLLP